MAGRSVPPRPILAAGGPQVRMSRLAKAPTLPARSVARTRNEYVWPRGSTRATLRVVSDGRLTVTHDPLSVRRWNSWLVSPEPLSTIVHFT